MQVFFEEKIKSSCFSKKGIEKAKTRKRYHGEKCDFASFLALFWVE
ncbi:hypothetical protein SAG0136_03720 [Streptococcus agalactiae LMG 14747]|uniref:Uncharacterized protein n=1 Tax=Streptococcus agalactiae LMG 14747 TaxID=1154860 RepID=V6Z0W4_STRAG|nr:hypothetical protein SAG0136_03720 [Streptococcus agalactiae LMG 14747]